MVRLLYTLSEIMKEKDIYIWDISKDSITEFTKLAIRGIDIQGFVVSERIYVGEQYMNRPIIGVQEILAEDTAIIILSEKCDRRNIPVEIAARAYVLSDLLCVDESLKDKNVYIYGAGLGGRDIYEKLRNSGIDIEAFCVTHDGNESIVDGKQVYQISEIPQGKNNAFIVSVLDKKMEQDIIDTLDMYSAEIYVRDFLDDNSILVLSLFQSIHKAWYEKRKVYIYTKSRGGYCQLMEKMLKTYGIKISGYIYKEAKEQSGIGNVFELAYEDIADIYVLVNDLDVLEREDQLEIYELLESVGLTMETFGYAGFRQITTTNWHRKYSIVPDPLMAWSIIYDDYNLPGIHVIGNRDKDDIRILILGGSISTDGILRPTSWVRKLYGNLTAKGIAVTVYDCAGPDEDVFQEFLRLVRDGIHLKPHYIISMSGGNNEINRNREENRVSLKHTLEWYHILAPDAPCVCGVPVKETAFAYWYRIQKIIATVAKVYGCKYYCFLQPMKAGKHQLSVFERSLHFSGDTENEAVTFRKESSKNDFYVNLLSLFDDKEGMYIDNGHFSEAGNAILAEIVSQEIWKELHPLEWKDL